MVIYKEAGEYKIIPAFDAFANGVSAIVCEIVSPDNQNAAFQIY